VLAPFAREIIANTAPVSIALIRQMMWRGLGHGSPMEAHKVDSRGIMRRRIGGWRGGFVVSRKTPGEIPDESIGRYAALLSMVKERPYS